MGGGLGWVHPCTLVVIAALEDDQGVALHSVDKAMFAVDAAGPEAGIIAAQGFRLADAFERVALAFTDQTVEFRQHRAVAVLPMDVLFKRVREEEDLHSFSNASSSSIVLTILGTPERKSAMALSSAALLAGEAVR